MASKYTLQNPYDVKREEERLLYESRNMANYTAARNNQLKRKKFQDFVSESKINLITEGLTLFTMKALPSKVSRHDKKMVKAIAENFVREEGANELLRRINGKTIFLSEFARLTEEAHETIIHGATEKPEEDDFSIKASDMSSYFDGLEDLGYDEMCKKIAERVANAEADFVKANIEDKKNIEDLTAKAQEKVGKIQADTEEAENEIKEEAARLYKKNLSNLQNRKRNILESIIRHFSEQVFVNESTQPIYCTEKGIDSNKAIESAEVIYTFLEMVNTMKFKTITPQYLTELISSIK